MLKPMSYNSHSLIPDYSTTITEPKEIESKELTHFYHPSELLAYTLARTKGLVLQNQPFIAPINT